MEEFKSGFVTIIGRTNVGKININKFISRRKSSSNKKQSTNNKKCNKRNSKQRKFTNSIQRYTRNT